MPNYVYCTLTVGGTAERIRAFVEQARGTQKPTGDPPGSVNCAQKLTENALEFNQLVPLPEEYSLLPYSPYGFEMERRTWGVKWGAFGVEGPTMEKDTLATYTFTCAWEPPQHFCEQVSERWPDLLIVLSYGGEGPCLGHFACHKGQLIDEEEGDSQNAPNWEENFDEEEEKRYEESYTAWVQQYRQRHATYVLSLC